MYAVYRSVMMIKPKLHWVLLAAITLLDMSLVRGVVDERTANTSVYVHSQTGICFILIPGGQFSTPGDGAKLSERAEVTMSPFIISASELTASQVLAILNGYMSEFTSGAEPGREHDNATGVSRAYDVVKMLTPLMSDEELFEFVSSPVFDPYGKDAASMDHLASTAHVLLSRLESRGHGVFDRSCYYSSKKMAAIVGGQLPTEAQWEMAAEVLKGTRAGESFGNQIGEACADYYSTDGLLQMSGRVDPPGAAFGSLSEKELEEQRASSSLAFVARWQAKRLRVLRDSSAGERHFLLPPEDGGFNEFRIESHWPESWGRRGTRIVIKPDNAQLFDSASVARRPEAGKVALVRADSEIAGNLLGAKSGVEEDP